MILLSLDSAGAGCSVCLVKNGEVLALAEEKMARGQDARLIPLVQEVMAQAACAFADLDRIAVTRGPGSFTGLRIGLAAARGLGLAANKPVIGIDRFSIYRAQHENAEGDLLIALESRRLELYVQFVPASGAPQEPALWPPKDIASFLAAKPAARVAGDRPESLGKFIGEDRFLLPAEPEVVTCAALAAAADPEAAAFLPRPLYLRAPDVTFSCKESV